jgi:hypothetical protein
VDNKPFSHLLTSELNPWLHFEQLSISGNKSVEEKTGICPSKILQTEIKTIKIWSKSEKKKSQSEMRVSTSTTAAE